jgi:aldehyde dehydrogenase (NAD+)
MGRATGMGPAIMKGAELIGALCRCADSLFNTTTTPESASLALHAASILAGMPRAPDTELVVAASRAHMAGDNGNLGLAHCLAMALETELDISHDLAVGVLMPRVIRFNAPIAGDVIKRLAVALEVEPEDHDPEQIAAGIEAALFDLYDKTGFPRYFDPEDFDPNLIPDMAMAAGRGLYGEGYLETPPTGQTLIPSPNRRRATISEGEELFERCFV